MIRLNNIVLSINEDMNKLEQLICDKLGINASEIIEFKVFRESIDARKSEIKFSYTIDVALRNEEGLGSKIDNKEITYSPNLEYKYAKKDRNINDSRPVIIGFGPAGMFCALILAQMGYKPIVIERGSDVDKRTNEVKLFWESGQLNPQSNVQFGEGGAGTFSDGKLTTRIKDSVRCNKVLEEFVRFGAPEEIIYKQKPHIGTDKLKVVVKALRKEIISLGGEIIFDTALTDVYTENGIVTGIKLSDGTSVNTNCLVLAIGHSARDTYRLLQSINMDMCQKPFAAGVRIEHPQGMIDRVQYGNYAGHPRLGAADYKLTCQTKTGRNVYSFCMCPGGEVIAAASQNGSVVTNGMSEYKRDKANANSALLVNVTPEDFKSDDPLAGMEFQIELEKKAFEVGGSNYFAPCQMVGDFLNRKASKKVGSVKPSYKPGVKMVDLHSLMPSFMSEAIHEGLLNFDRKIKGFANEEAIMTGIETRSSAPVRLNRDEHMQSNIKGIYPIGEGSGYAGGIVSSAVDGIKCAEMIASIT